MVGVTQLVRRWVVERLDEPEPGGAVEDLMDSLEKSLRAARAIKHSRAQGRLTSSGMPTRTRWACKRHFGGAAHRTETVEIEFVVEGETLEEAHQYARNVVEKTPVPSLGRQPRFDMRALVTTPVDALLLTS